MGTASISTDTVDSSAVPGYRNYLIYADESGMDGAPYYGFGSLWMPQEARGRFSSQIRAIREKHNYFDEIGWNGINKRSHLVCRDLLDFFFRNNWLMFHCLIVRKGYTDKSFHKDFDEEKRKRFSMLIGGKIRFFSQGDLSKLYHARIDPLPSRYEKADEAAHKIINSTIMAELNIKPLKTLLTCDSRKTPGIQFADLILGAIMAAWRMKGQGRRGKVESAYKLEMIKCIADFLGWKDLFAGTFTSEWKFNIWYFHDPTSGIAREVSGRPVRHRYPVKPYNRLACTPGRSQILTGTNGNPR